MVEASNVSIAGSAKTVALKPLRFEYQGATYFGVPLTGVEYVLGIEDRLRQLRVDPVLRIAPQLKALEGMPAMQEQLLRMAYEESKEQHREYGVSQADVSKFLGTREGLTYVIFLSLRKAHADMTEELATRILLSKQLTELADDAKSLNLEILKAADAKRALDAKAEAEAKAKADAETHE